MNKKWDNILFAIGGLVVVAALAIFIYRTVLDWWGVDLPVPPPSGDEIFPQMRHNVQSGRTYTFGKADRGKSVDFTNPEGASALLKDFDKGYFVSVFNHSSGPVTLETQKGPKQWLIGGHPTLELPPRYGCTLVSDGDGYELLLMSNK
jgi:hypothetical protein